MEDLAEGMHLPGIVTNVTNFGAFIDIGVHQDGLAPMAVLPEHQRKGLGSDLIGVGLEQCRQMGSSAVVVLGHPDYYPRFGFRPASGFGIDSEYDAPDEVFLVLELEPGFLVGKSGRIKYHQAFSSF